MDGTRLLRKWRKDSGYTQREAGALFGVSQQYVARWETGILPMVNYAIVMEAKTHGAVPVRSWAKKRGKR